MDGVDSGRAMDVLRRLPVLAACRDDPLDRRRLSEVADLSRTTAYRATTDLAERGLLEETGAGYRTTPRGRALLAATEEFRTGLATVEGLAPLFDVVSHPELLEHAHLLTDPTVIVADATNPYRVVERVLERYEATERSRGTITNPTAGEAIDTALPELGEKEHIERILTASALEAHDTIAGEQFRAATEREGLSLLTAADEAVPFTFAIDDEDVTVVGHDPTTGLPTVHVASANPAARDWLERVYGRCRGAAEPV